MIELITTYNIVMVISVVINIVLLIGVRNLLKQNEQFEDNLIQVRGRIANTLKKMRDLDNREVFEKDDEVGVTFSELKKLIEDLNNEI
jgi:competence protein ComGC|tara:strand:+ start:132 stop:395 length:264 start_codon:yes stop_codon:yes gene_type:complete